MSQLHDTIVDPFSPPIEIWRDRWPTPEERLAHLQKNGSVSLKVRDTLACTLSNPVDAVARLLDGSVEREPLSSQIENRLQSNAAFRKWRAEMPSRTPAELARYQRMFRTHDRHQVDLAVRSTGFRLPVGQVLFHGGVWPDPKQRAFVTDRPLSTTLQPTVALNNALHNGKAFDRNVLELFVVTVCSEHVPAFVFRTRGANLAHEHEVLLPSGIRLELKGELYLRDDFEVHKYQHEARKVPARVLEVSVL